MGWLRLSLARVAAVVVVVVVLSSGGDPWFEHGLGLGVGVGTVRAERSHGAIRQRDQGRARGRHREAGMVLVPDSHEQSPASSGASTTTVAGTSSVILQRLYDLRKTALGERATQALCVCSAANNSACDCSRPRSARNSTGNGGGVRGSVVPEVKVLAMDKDRRKRVAHVQTLELSQQALDELDTARAQNLREKVLPDEIDSLAADTLGQRRRTSFSGSAISHQQDAGSIFDLLRQSHFVLSVPAVQEYYNRLKAEIVSEQSDILAIQRGMNLVAEMKAASTQKYRASDRTRQMRVALGNRQVFAASAAQQKALDALHAQLDAQSGATLSAIEARKKALEDLLRKELANYMARLGQKNPDLENLRRQAGLLRQQVADAQALLARAIGDTMSPCMTSDDCGLAQACRHRMCTPVGEHAKCKRNADCGNGQFCHVDRCESVRPPVGSKCNTNAECGFGTRCKYFRCVMTPEGHACSADRGCGNGQQCIAHQCRWIALPENASCSLSRDCAFGQHCVAAPHLKLAGASMVSEDMSLATANGAGLCQFVPQGTECGGRLSLQGNCGVQQMCSNGQCVFLGAESTVKCKATEDCGVGQVCSFRLLTDDSLFGESLGSLHRDNRSRARALAAGYNGRCSFAQYGRTCEDSLECVFGQRCAKHICQNVAPGSACTLTSDCGNGQECLKVHNGSSVCHGRRDASVPCNVNAECSVAQRCMGSLCVATPHNTKCVDDNDCGNHMKCKDLRCHLEAPPESDGRTPAATLRASVQRTGTVNELFPVNRPCQAAADCARDDACIFGFCTRLPIENEFCTATADDATSNGRRKTQCALNQECKHNVCNPLYEIGLIQEGGVCESIGDCANGQSCRAGRCAVVPDGAPCSDSSVCGRSQVCLLGKCYSSGSPCASNFNCAIGQRCVGNRCEASALEPVPPPCSSHSDCGNGQLCSLQRRICVWTASPKRENDACSVAPGQQCSSGQRCSNGRCQTIKTGKPCTSHANCGSSQTCFAGFCMWTQPADGTRCVTPFDCGSGQNCILTTAVELPTPKGMPVNSSVCLTIPEHFRCSGIAQCGNGQQCVKGGCLTVALTPGSSCDNSPRVVVNSSQSVEEAARQASQSHPQAKQPCGARQACVEGECKSQYHTGLSMPAGSVCTDAYACGSGQRCVGGVCHEVEAYDPCTSNAECGNGQQCHNSHCVNVFFGSHCLGSFDCGMRQLCQANRCIPQYGNALTTSVPAGSQCASHIQCSFNMLCDTDGRCKFASSTTCHSNGDCGNGVRCDFSTNKCVASPHGSYCSPSGAAVGALQAMLPPPATNSTKPPNGTVSFGAGPVKCGNGQLCVKSRCVDQYGRGAPTMNIPVGTNCFGSADCGHSQRCDSKCAFVEEASPCVSTSNCGNGQRCVSGACTTRQEGRPCGSGGDSDCAHGQTCVHGACLRQYGRSLEIELAVRAEEDITMDQEWKTAVMRRLSGISALIAALAAANKTGDVGNVATNPAAAAAELQKLAHEQQRLREGRKILEAEVQRRADLSFADGFSGGLLNEGCALCKVGNEFGAPRINNLFLRVIGTIAKQDFLDIFH
eukprot:INCI17305.3.p1 GENE.INCI17305.3~~INCI17305.3.p1  ORF type:complete len:1568 (-),score=203.56 INCI17305.3:1371-6074(-)